MSTEVQETQTETMRFPDELVASSTFLLKRLGFAAKHKAMDAYEEVGLSPYQHAILILLEEGDRDTQASIADVLGYDRGQLVGWLDELEEQKLIERRRDPDDRRRHVVRLTADGKRTLKRLRSIAGQIEEEFLAPLDDDQRAKLHALLLELAAAHEPRCAGASPPAG